MTVRTRAQLNTDADTYLADNATGDISPQDVRDRIKDLADSALLTGDPLGGGETACNGRLTLESGVGVSTTDQTAKTTLYFTPFKGNKVGVYISGAWVVKTLTEISLSLAAYTASKPYDIFLYDNAGTLTLESLVWTDDTTRATALALQDGIPIKSGDATRRYLGTIYITTTIGQCEDSLTKRYVWNCYNRVRRPMRRIDSTDTWSYATHTLRQARANASNQLDFVLGLSEDAVSARVIGTWTQTGTTTAGGTVAIGLDSTTAKATGSLAGSAVTTAANQNGMAAAALDDIIAVGKHRLVWLEAGEQISGTPTINWNGDNGSTFVQSGISGSVAG